MDELLGELPSVRVVTAGRHGVRLALRAAGLEGVPDGIYRVAGGQPQAVG